MDLFTSRCGCGAIFRPAVRTQKTCTSCQTRQAQSARVALGTNTAIDTTAVNKRFKYQRPYTVDEIRQGTQQIADERAAKDAKIKELREKARFKPEEFLPYGSVLPDGTISRGGRGSQGFDVEYEAVRRLDGNVHRVARRVPMQLSDGMLREIQRRVLVDLRNQIPPGQAHKVGPELTTMIMESFQRHLPEGVWVQEIQVDNDYGLGNRFDVYASDGRRNYAMSVAVR